MFLFQIWGKGHCTLYTRNVFTAKLILWGGPFPLRLDISRGGPSLPVPHGCSMDTIPSFQNSICATGV